MNNKLTGLLALCATLFSCVTSWAGVAEELAKLKSERSTILSDIKKRAGGDSTIAYRALKKNAQPQLDELGRKITALEKLVEYKASL